MSAVPEKAIEEAVIKLDFGCGKNKAAGFHGVDSIAFEGVDTVLNVVEEEYIEGTYNPAKGPRTAQYRFKSWPWADESVAEVHSSHFLEHLEARERVHFFNELYRVMKKGAQARIITPHWSNSCSLGDPTHRWPATSEWYVYYLNKGWRDGNAPHSGFTCDFDFVVGGSWDSWLEVRNMDTRIFAMSRYINSYRDLIVTLTKR